MVPSLTVHPAGTPRSTLPAPLGALCRHPWEHPAVIYSFNPMDDNQLSSLSSSQSPCNVSGFQTQGTFP